LAVLALLTTLALVPGFFVSKAQKKGGGKGLATRTESHADGIPNYDIRLDKNSIVRRGELRMRDSVGANAAADLRDTFVAAEAKLKSRRPELQIEYSPETGVPEVIGPDVRSGKAAIESVKGNDRVETLRGFLRSNKDLLGVPDHQVDELDAVADYTNPAGNMSWVILEQKIDSIPVFRGEVVAGYGKDGSLARVVNGLAAGVDPAGASREFRDPRSAVEAAAGHIGHQLRPFETEFNAKSSESNRAVFGEGDFGTVAEKMYFPLEPGTVVPAWRVLMRQDVASYYVIVDARSGDLLWRKNLTEDQTQSASYRVYTNPNAMVNIADSPFPITPGPTSPSFANQGSAISRTLVTRIGNEDPYQFNNLGWLTDGATTLDGNNVQAGLDRELPNTGSPANPNDIDPTGVPAASSGRTFDFAFNPATPDPSGSQTGDSPLPAGQTATGCLANGTNAAPTDFQKAVTTQLFYITNVYHDEMYRLGFTEQHRNFQTDNFGRGGIGNDRISAQAQDCSGNNNANFTTPSDGNRPTMQMYLWTNPAIDIDGSVDADVIIHELTHGLSNRLHGNASGLGSLDFSRGMGEGWSDFYAHAMLSEPTDPINGVYSTGAYDTYQLRGALNSFGNSYYGIRRFPKAVMAFTGGPNNRPHNPLTFADIDSTKINLSDGAFAPASNPVADQVHAVGEVWSSALWEVRARMVQRLGWAEGNRRVLQIVTDGMKLSPAGPNFITGRDAIVAAARAGGSSADVDDVWRGFAIRGVGYSASVQNNGGVSTGGNGSIRVTEAFDMPNLSQTPEMTVSDTPAGDGDGFPEPGETVRLTIPLANLTGTPATGVVAQVVGSSSLSYGTIADNGTASNVFDFTIPAGIACGGVVDVTINVTSSLGPITFVRKISTGQPIVTSTQNFDGVTAPALPAGWEVLNDGNAAANPFVTTTTTPNSAPNAAFAPNPNVGTSLNGSTSLISPTYAVASPSATVSFRHRYNTEASWDGGVLEINMDGGPFQDIIAAGGSFKQNGYNGFLNDNDNPIDLRSAWTGNSGGYVTTVAQLPTSAAGKNVRLRWRFGSDNNTGVEGWFVDDVAFSAQSQCSFVSGPNKRSDFDGDGRSDLAVYRPADGNWHILPSNKSGYTAFKWGISRDVPTPADFDNDGKTDAAIYRPGLAGGSSVFWALKSSNFTYTAVAWGIEGDVPVVRDYDGDKLADYALYRPAERVWYILEADGGFQGYRFGSPGDVPVAGDFDGDGKGDLTVYNNGSWKTRRSSDGSVVGAGWGIAGDLPVPADYDNDGKDDYAIFRPANGTWWMRRSSDNSYTVKYWGMNGDIPVPGDYDGDGKYDPAVYRNGVWWTTYSSTGSYGVVQFGITGDIPIPKGYIP
jgi:hypothetical protein